MQTNLKKTVWELDARWLRVEACDEEGQSLGLVYFEPNEQAPLPVAVRSPKSGSGLLFSVARRWLGASSAASGILLAATPRNPAGRAPSAEA